MCMSVEFSVCRFSCAHNLLIYDDNSFIVEAFKVKCYVSDVSAMQDSTV